ncbi:MAG: protein kinase domain-containing protein, partial [Gemmataceae bacterium]
MSDSSEDRDPLDRLAEEFVARYRAGERPSLKEYEAKLPERAEEVRDLFPALIEMEQLKPITRDEAETTPTINSADPERVGDFRILRRIGVGGMGVVYEALQESLGRHVALKMLPADQIHDPKRLERFRREARSAARLHHTNIVPVFGVGEANGRHFYAMQFIAGHPLDAVIGEVRRLKNPSPELPNIARGVSEMAAALVTGTFIAPLPELMNPPTPEGSGTITHVPAPTSAELPVPTPPSSLSSAGSTTDRGGSYWATVARMGAQVADALAYAHGQGILHRDIKPSNLLLDLQGTVWVADFGLAKSIDADDLTHTGDIIGTMRYMAPERFDGLGDHRADIYALGLTLYEMLTLQPAFHGANKAKLIEHVLAANPVRPRVVNAQIPRDLETIVLKSIQRDPAMRYSSATELAEDLRRYTQDRPIRARRASLTEQAWRWCRRNPAVATLLSTVMVLFATGTAVSLFYAQKAAEKAREAQTKTVEAKKLSDEATERLFQSLVSQAEARRGSRRKGQRFQGLDTIREAALIQKTPELRDLAIACLALPDVQSSRLLTQPEGNLASIDIDIDHACRVELHVFSDGTVRITDTIRKKSRVIIPGDGVFRQVELSRCGRWIRTIRINSQTELSIWSVADPSAPLLRFSTGNWNTSCFRSDGNEYAIWENGQLNRYELPSGRKIGGWPLLTAQRIVYRPHPVQLTVVDVNKIRLHQLETGEVVTEFSLPKSAPAIAWSPDGTRFAVTGQPDITIWNVDTKMVISSVIRDTSGGDYCAFDPTGRVLLSNGWAGQFHLSDVNTGRLLLTIPGGSYTFRALIDGQMTGVPPVNNQVALSRLASGEELIYYNRAEEPRPFGSVHPGGRLLASVSKGAFHLWDRERLIGTIPVPRPSEAHTAIFNQRGELVTHSSQGNFQWSVVENAGQWIIGPPKLIIRPQESLQGMSDDGRRMLTYGNQYQVRDMTKPSEVINIDWYSGIAYGVISPDGRYVATGCHNGTQFVIWDPATGNRIHSKTSESVTACRFSPDNQWVLTTGFQSPQRLFRVGT